MSADLEPLLKRLHLANARRVWRDMCQRAEKEEWPYEALLVGSLLTPDFVTEGRSVILEGKPGRGKSHLAIAIAYRAMQNGFDALFTTAAQLIEELSAASREGKLREALARTMKPHVLVVDEVGHLAYGDDAASVLYHVVNDRHIRGRSMIFTTNKHPKRWGDVLHDDDLADAIVDRILERGRLLRLDGPSVRTKHLPDDELRIDVQDNTGGGRVSGIEAAEFPERTVRKGTAFRRMVPTMATKPGSARRDDADRAVVDAAHERGVPLISVEGLKTDGTFDAASYWKRSVVGTGTMPASSVDHVLREHRDPLAHANVHPAFEDRERQREPAGD